MTGAERGYDPKAEGSRASRVLEERNEAFRVLYDTVVETGGAPGELLYETLCRNLRRICSAQWAALASFDPKTQTLTVQSVSREKDTSAPLSQKDLRKNAPLTDEEVTTLTQNQIRECRGKADCPVRFFPGFDDKNTSFEGLCTVTCVREDRLLAVGVVGLPRGRRLRLEDIIGTYLHLCGMLIQRAESMASDTGLSLVLALGTSPDQYENIQPTSLEASTCPVAPALIQGSCGLTLPSPETSVSSRY